ncbi:Leucine-rich repeat-containing protein 2 [Chytriomyces hyalinus]|nr:Leucine-rich repeat-containing protein 2 [Chytriomyces hyalinus]
MKRQRTEPNAENKGHRATPDAASDALPMPSLETITATLSVILHTIEKMQAEVTDIKETQSSLINAQRHLSNQVLDLQNKSKKFFTYLRDLPVEIIIQIFAWIPVQTVLKYRRLSRTINQLLLTDQFAMLNMQTTTDFKKGSNRLVGGLWFLLPLSYQTLVARVIDAQVTSIFGWGFSEKDEYKNIKKRLPKSITLSGLRQDSGRIWCIEKLDKSALDLDLSYNQLSGDFPALPNLNALEIVNIGGNRFTGPLPTVFGNSKRLEYFLAGSNRFNVIPPSIDQLTRLHHLSICHNPFACEIPPEVLNLATVDELEMNDCKMFGSLAGIGNLVNIGVLNLSGNQFTGEFPSREIFNMQNLHELHLAGSHFSGGEILDMSDHAFKMTMCLDREFQRKYVIRQGFHKCRMHGLFPFGIDISDSEREDENEEEEHVHEEDGDGEAWDLLV